MTSPVGHFNQGSHNQLSPFGQPMYHAPHDVSKRVSIGNTVTIIDGQDKAQIQDVALTTDIDSESSPMTETETETDLGPVDANMNQEDDFNTKM